MRTNWPRSWPWWTPDAAFAAVAFFGLFFLLAVTLVSNRDKQAPEPVKARDVLSVTAVTLCDRPFGLLVAGTAGTVDWYPYPVEPALVLGMLEEAGENTHFLTIDGPICEGVKT